MNEHAPGWPRPLPRARTGAGLTGNPLDFMLGDHLREREVCKMLDRIAQTRRVTPDEAGHIAGIIAEALPLHLRDAEEELFPLLRRRCQPEDEIDQAIDRLRADRRRALAEAPRVLAALEALRDDAPQTPDLSALPRYVAQVRRYLMLEQAIILPFARLRLTDHDLDALRLRMLQHRGLDRLLERLDTL